MATDDMGTGTRQWPAKCDAVTTTRRRYSSRRKPERTGRVESACSTLQSSIVCTDASASRPLTSTSSQRDPGPAFERNSGVTATRSVLANSAVPIVQSYEDAASGRVRLRM
eukprot:Amastigsp_a676669_8.p6 type:complete len:111 gc:universal Amastigsp_a676669_8:947-615(-)